MRSIKRYSTVACGGADVHYQFSQVAMLDSSGQVVVRERLDHRDRSALRQRLAQWPRGLPMVLEASFGWAWLSDEMRAAGIDVRLSNCYKLGKFRCVHGGVKTNDKDAELLALLPQEKTNWWEVWLPPADVRDLREVIRLWCDLKQLSTQTKNRIHSIFHRHGIFHDFDDLFSPPGREFLVRLCKDGVFEGGRLQAGAMENLVQQVALSQNLREAQLKVTKYLRRHLRQSDLGRRLDEIPGFGLILVEVIMAEMGQIDRFRSHDALANYSLLAPRAMDTGLPDPNRRPLGRHLGYRGNHTLKWAFIQAARGAVRKGGRFRMLFDRATDGGVRNKGRGYIKVARELVKIVYILWRKGLRYDPSALGRGVVQGPGRQSESNSFGNGPALQRHGRRLRRLQTSA